MAKENDLIPMKNSALATIAAKRASQENGVKTIDPPIKRTQTTDPETGAITYRQSWESSSSTRGTSAGKKTTPSVRKTTSISPVGSKVQPSKSTSSKTVTPGSREVTTVPIPKAAGRTDNKITAPPIKVEAPVKRSTREDIIYSKRKKENETREEFDKRDKEEDERLNKNALKNQRKGDGNEGKIMTGKNQGTTCRNC